METKRLQIELKADQEGAVSAVFSRFDVADHDGDVTLRGAFTTGAKVSMLPAHDVASYRIGKGIIREQGDVAVFEGQFNLKTDLGRNWYESIKFDTEDGQPQQEWSYGYDVEDAEYGMWNGQQVRFLKRLKVHEVSPVFLGAGIGTSTLSVKSMTFEAEDEAVRAAVASYKARWQSLADSLVKEGRPISAARRERMKRAIEAFREAAADLEAMLAETEPQDPAKSADALLAQFLATQARIRGIQVGA